MSTTLIRTLAILLVFAAGAAAGALFTHGDDDFPPGGDEGRTRLLVRCKADGVPAVLTALEDQPVEVWSLRSREPLRLDTPEPAPDGLPPSDDAPPPETPTAPPAAPFQDAVRVLDAIQAALDTVEGPMVQMRSCRIRESRAVVEVLLEDAAKVDAVADALGASDWLQVRGTRIEPGALQALGHPQKRMKTQFSLRFEGPPVVPEGGPPAGPKPTADAALLHSAVWKAATQGKVQVIWASAEMREEDRAGRVSLSREYKFQNATVGSMRAFLTALAEAAPHLTVYELNWPLNPRSDGRRAEEVLTKPTVRVGVRAGR